MVKATDVVDLAYNEIGKPYVYGDEGPNSFDCSGLVQYVFGKLGVQLPRTARQQQASVPATTRPRFGDLVFYGQPAHHVGIYVGSGFMIDAPDVNQKVKFEKVGNATSYGHVAAVTDQPKNDLPPSPHTGINTPIGEIPGKVGGAIAGALGITDVKALVLESLFVLTGLGLIALGLIAQKRRLAHE